MTQPSPSTISQTPERAHLLDEFDRAWRAGTAPLLEEFVRQVMAGDQAIRQELLQELIKIDLDYRWRPGAKGGPLRLEDYLRQVPELGPIEQVPLELIAEEFWARRRWGGKADAAEYAERFPLQAQRLTGVFAQVERELAEEFAEPGPATDPGASLPMAYPVPSAASFESDTLLASGDSVVQPIDSVNGLIGALRELQLVNTAALNELILAELQGRFSSPQELGKLLLDRGWLTAYQVNRLFVGRGGELLAGPYLLLERLGQGGTGQVFKARHRRMDRVVALKLIRPDLLADADVVARFYREIKLASQLDHPHVVHAFDAGPIGDTHFLAMEFVEGTDLNRLVKESGPLPAGRACDFIRQAALGLQHAHEHGLVHRDVKPSNLFLCQRGSETIKVLDLGLARLCRSNAEFAYVSPEMTNTLTPLGGVVMMGTPDYMAPEQALNFHGADVRADIYSLGCTLFFLLTGKPPFAGGTMPEKLVRHQQAPPPLEELCGDFPGGLPAVLSRMLAKRPEDRYQMPAEVAAALESLSNGECPEPAVLSAAVGLPASAAPDNTMSLPVAMPVSDHSTIYPEPLVAPQRTAKRWLPWVAAALAAVGLVGFLTFLISPPPQSGHSLPTTRKILENASLKGLVDGSPSPLDNLDARAISPGDRIAGQPEELVAVARGLADDNSIVAFRPPSGNVLVTNQGNARMQLFDLSGVKPVPHAMEWRSQGVIETDGIEIASATFHPGGRWFLASSRGKNLYYWDFAAGAKRGETFTMPVGVLKSLSVRADGQQLAVVSAQTFSLWLVNFSQGKFTGPELVQEYPGRAVVVAFAPRGSSLACGTEDGGVRLWDTASKKPKRHLLKGHTRSVNAVGFAADGTALVSGGDDGTVRLWDLARPDPKERTKLEGHAGKVNTVVFAPNGKIVVSGDDRGAVILWNAKSSKKLRQWPMPGPVRRVAFAPDGRHLAIACNGAVYILRLAPPTKSGLRTPAGTSPTKSR